MANQQQNNNRNLINLRIITPNGIFWDQLVEIATVKTTEGFIGLQKNRIPFVASLDIDTLFINNSKSSKFRKCAIAGGVVFVTKQEIIIITDAIEFAEKIDLNRAKRAKTEAEAIVKRKKSSNSEYLQAELALEKAINRIRVRTNK